MEVGAGTFQTPPNKTKHQHPHHNPQTNNHYQPTPHPATTIAAWGRIPGAPPLSSLASAEDGSYARIPTGCAFLQFKVILKPSPANSQAI